MRRMVMRIDYPEAATNDILVTLNLEGLRTFMYGVFYALVITGMVLTSKYADVNWEDNIILNTFGTNNICVNFDYPPATYVLPVMWAIFVLVASIERLISLSRVWVAHFQTRISVVQYQTIKALISYQIFSLCFFSLCFAVQPHDLITLRVHTIPFSNLIVALATMSFSNIWFAQVVGYQGYEFSKWFTPVFWLYVSLLFVVSAHQVSHHVYSLGYGVPWSHAPFPVSMSLGKVWLVLVIVMPPCFNIFLSCVLPGKAVEVSFKMNLAGYLAVPPA